MSVLRKTAALTAATTLAGIGALHYAWGKGETYPFDTKEELDDAVCAGKEFPPAQACNAVAGSLGVAALLTLGVGHSRWWGKLGRTAVVGVLAARGIAGVTGLTKETLREAPAQERFAELDKNVYGPLCLTLAALIRFGTKSPSNDVRDRPAAL
jgi:Protein of unknown function (DUF3995)